MNWRGLEGLSRVSGAKKTKFSRVLEETRYLVSYQFKNLGRLQTILVQAGSLKGRFYGSLTAQYQLLELLSGPSTLCSSMDVGDRTDRD